MTEEMTEQKATEGMEKEAGIAYTQAVPANGIGEYLNQKWVDGFMPRQDDVPTASNPEGDITITVYPKEDNASYICTVDRPWSVVHSSSGHAERLEAQHKERGFILYYPPIKKPTADSDTQAKNDELNHTRIVMIFFKGAVIENTSSGVTEPSVTPSAAPTTESETASGNSDSLVIPLTEGSLATA